MAAPYLKCALEEGEEKASRSVAGRHPRWFCSLGLGAGRGPLPWGRDRQARDLSPKSSDSGST